MSMMSRMKELEDENRCLKKMYLEEKLKAEILSKTLEKSDKAISHKGHDLGGGHSELHTFELRILRYVSASPATASSVSSMLETTRLPIG